VILFLSIPFKGTVSLYKPMQLLIIGLECLGKLYVAAIHEWLWLIEAWGMLIVRHEAILIVRV